MKLKKNKGKVKIYLKVKEEERKERRMERRKKGSKKGMFWAENWSYLNAELCQMRWLTHL